MQVVQKVIVPRNSSDISAEREFGPLNDFLGLSFVDEWMIDFGLSRFTIFVLLMLPEGTNMVFDQVFGSTDWCWRVDDLFHFRSFFC